MKNVLKILIFVAIILCSTAACTQDKEMQSIKNHLKNGDCISAEKAYSAWKIANEKTNFSIEQRIAECKSEYEDGINTALTFINYFFPGDTTSIDEIDIDETSIDETDIDNEAEEYEKYKEQIYSLFYLDSLIVALTTDKFKEEAFAAYTEEDLDYDPLVDGQDSPTEFEFGSFSKESKGCGYVTVKGKGIWDSFKLPIRIVKENGKWLVDGCGDINIPEEKMARKI